MHFLIAQIKERIIHHTYYKHEQTVKVLKETLAVLEKQNDSTKSMS